MSVTVNPVLAVAHEVGTNMSATAKVLMRNANSGIDHEHIDAVSCISVVVRSIQRKTVLVDSV